MHLEQIIYVIETNTSFEFDIVDENMDQYVIRIFKTRGTYEQIKEIVIKKLGLIRNNADFVWMIRK